MPPSPSQNVRIPVAIVDDDPVLRDALQQTVSKVPGVEILGSVATLAEARALAAKGPKIFFIDLGLPDGSGLELIEALEKELPDCHLIVVSIFGDVERVVRAIELGAEGYLLKGAGLEQTASAIEVVLQGGAPLSPAIAGHILKRVRATAPTQPAEKTELTLTPREKSTLEGLAKGLSFKELATAMGISHHTVGDHVKAIYRKMQVSSRGEAIFEAAQQGLIRMNR